MRTGLYLAILLVSAAVPRAGWSQSQNSGWQLSGRVLVEGGGIPPARVEIDSVCNGNVYVSGYTDRGGTFSFRAGPTANPALQDASVGLAEGSFGRPRSSRGSPPANTPGDESSSTSSGVDYEAPPAPTGVRRNSGGDQLLRNCELRFLLAGYHTDPIPLANRKQGDGSDLGTVILRPLAPADGTTVSVSSLKASGRARAAFEKGRKAARNGEAGAARESFRKAVEAYPGYAAAWFELGSLEAQQNRPEEAREAFAAAIKADAHYPEPYFGLATLQSANEQWRDLAETMDKLIRLAPIRLPRAYYLSAAANYNLGNLDAAESAARQSQKLDIRMEFPRSWYLLGRILERRRDFAGAAEQLREFLRIAPQAADRDAVQKEVARLTALGGGPSF